MAAIVEGMAADVAVVYPLLQDGRFSSTLIWHGVTDMHEYICTTVRYFTRWMESTPSLRGDMSYGL